MYKTVINNLIKIRNEIDELRSNEKELNKYQNLCFDEIINDLDNMQSFVKALKFRKDHLNEFRSETSND